MRFLHNTSDFVVTTSFTTDNGTDNSTHSPSELEGDTDDVESLSLYKVAMMLWKVCPPAILLLGTFGNVMTLVILRHMDFMSTYFVALAVSDLLFLYTIPLESFLWNVIDIDLLASNEVVCRVLAFAPFILPMTSSWFLVCMTMERVTSVVWPHKVGLLCSKRKSRVTVVVVTVLLMALCAHQLAVFTVQRTQEDDNTTSSSCTFVDDEDLVYYDEFVFNWIDLLFSSFIPAVLLFVGNAVLVFTVVRSTYRARRLSVGQRNSQAKREKTASSLTLTLIGVSVTYLVLTLPVCVVVLVSLNVDWDSQDVHFEARFELLWAVSAMMWYSNSAVNFYIYCLTGAKFRKKCLRLLCCCIARATRSSSSSGVSGVSVSVSMSSGGMPVTGDTASESRRNNVDQF